MYVYYVNNMVSRFFTKGSLHCPESVVLLLVKMMISLFYHNLQGKKIV